MALSKEKFPISNFISLLNIQEGWCLKRNEKLNISFEHRPTSTLLETNKIKLMRFDKNFQNNTHVTIIFKMPTAYWMTNLV